MRSWSDVIILILAASIVVASGQTSAAQPVEVPARYIAQRDAFLDGFRTSGQQDRAQLDALTSGLATLVDQSTGELRARALLELAAAQRIGSNYETAIATYSRAVEAAAALGMRDVAFAAWIGIARAQEYGTLDHGAAAIAFERAADIVGEQASAKQSADLTQYRAQLEIGRGEIEAGIIDALHAIDLAVDRKDRFYAELDFADGLTKLVQSCDYRPLIDAASSDDGPDSHAACRRAVAATQTAYERAGATAAALGWTFMVNQVRQFQTALELRRQLIERRARLDARITAVPFQPRSVADVLVSKTFESGASMLTDMPALAKLVDSVASEAEASANAPSARNAFLHGLKTDILGEQPQKAAEFYATAATILETERRGYFDPRRRGTVIENRGEMVESLALRLLSLGREADAFAAFEIGARPRSQRAGERPGVA